MLKRYLRINSLNKEIKFGFFKRLKNYILEEKLADTSNPDRDLPMQQTDDRFHIQANIHMDRLKELENIQEISELEKQRLKSIDQALDTNTHFHDIEKYEDRVDSQTVMSLRQLMIPFLRQKPSEIIKSNFKYDPQEKRKRPKIVNFIKYSNEILQNRQYPTHNVLSQSVEFPFEKQIDPYYYFKIDNQVFQQDDLFKQIEFEKSFQFYNNFIISENMYTDFTFTRSQFLQNRFEVRRQNFK